MSDLGDALQGIWTLLDMIGSLASKVFRGKLTTLPGEWRSRDHGWLGLVILILITLDGYLVKSFIVI